MTNNNTRLNTKQWYYQTWAVYILIILFFPVGFICLWKSSNFSEEKKWSISFILPIILAFTYYFNEDTGIGNEYVSKKKIIKEKVSPKVKKWGDIEVSLKEKKFAKNNVVVKLIFKNLGDSDESFFANLQSEMINFNGIKGTLNAGSSDCSGKMHPDTILNCKLDFKFTETVNQVSLKIGAGILEDAVYFKFKRE